jgi:hypothetical protein
MTEKEKRTILDMRAAGRQYKEISAELGIEVSALKVFVHRQKHKDVRRFVLASVHLPIMRCFLNKVQAKLRKQDIQP